jgi:hypothetical protein
MISRNRLAIALPVCLIFVFGCNKASSVGSAVHGTVTYKNSPVPGGTITYVGTDGGKYSGNIDKDGKYALRDMPAGKYTVVVDNRALKNLANQQATYQGGQPGQKGGDPMAMNDKMLEKMGGRDKAKAAQQQTQGEYREIPPRYESEKTSTETVTLDRGDQKHDIELTD